MADPIADPVVRYDPTYNLHGYNNASDRIKVELPARSSSSAGGVVSVLTASGTDSIPVYLNGVPVNIYDTDPALNRIIEKSWGALTGPSSTEPLLSLSASKHTFQYTVSELNSSVLVAASGSLDASGWFNLMESSGYLVPHTKNGTYRITHDGVVKYVLFSLMGETGGTDARVTVKYLGGY